jgi:RNA polymerase sigma-70 factor (ECF subfamily)
MAYITAQDAIEKAYKEHATQLWRGVYAFSGGSRDVADDAVAEAFARALEHAERIRCPLPWLYRVAFRQAATRLREKERGVDIEPAIQPDGGNPSRAIALLRPLSPKQRAILFLFYYADFSIADIARATESSQVGVRVQLHRAREALRKSYGSATAVREEMSTGGST